jgi:hypothetical protein
VTIEATVTSTPIPTISDRLISIYEFSSIHINRIIRWFTSIHVIESTAKVASVQYIPFFEHFK